MTGEQFQGLHDFFKRTRLRRQLVFFASKLLPIVNVVVYLALLGWLFAVKNGAVIRAVLVPAVTFLFITILRAFINRPRPYDMLDYTPFFPVKSGKGKSFPSRHAASAVIIAMASLYVNATLGAIMLIIAYAIAASRVITGAHYLVDVICAVIISHIFGILGFWIL